jgi:hypothetical protein
MRLVLSRPVMALVAFAIVWLTTGRQLTSLLDRLITLRIASLPVSPIAYDGGGLVIGQLQLTFGATDNQRSRLALCSDSSNQVILAAAGRSFTLGRRTNPVDPSGRPEIEFVASPGDKLDFSASKSVLGWPTPFELNLLGGRSPWWKRYVYYRLHWTKRDGAQLAMVWRYEQDITAPAVGPDPQ